MTSSSQLVSTAARVGEMVRMSHNSELFAVDPVRRHVETAQ
jgi:hypothetical protein